MLTRIDEGKMKEEFARDGYAVIRGFFDQMEVQGVSERVSRFINELLPRLSQTEANYEDRSKPESIKHIPHLSTHDSFFKELMSSDRFVRLAERLLDDQVIPAGTQWFNKIPGIGGPTPAHQDGYYFMLEPNEAVTMWLALDAVDDANGCLRYVPGSHRAGMRPHGKTEVVGFSQAITDYDQDDRKREVTIRAKPGDLLLHHSMTIHSAGGNTSPNRQRRALQMVYYAHRAKQDTKRVEAYQESLARGGSGERSSS